MLGLTRTPHSRANAPLPRRHLSPLPRFVPAPARNSAVCAAEVRNISQDFRPLPHKSLSRARFSVPSFGLDARP